jgi:hypothetical protein
MALPGKQAGGNAIRFIGAMHAVFFHKMQCCLQEVEAHVMVVWILLAEWH